MYIETVPNRNSKPAILLRESRREGKRVVKKTLLNLTDWPKSVVRGLRRLLAGENLVCVDDVFAIERSLPHGHVEAVLGCMRQLGFDALLASRPCRERDLLLAMIAARVMDPCSKLGTTRLWTETTLARELGVAHAHVNDLYDALDWLLARQDRIEKKLAGRHLGEGAIAMYDVSNSYYEGRTCPLAALGKGRDGKRGLPVIAYGLMTDLEGRPLAIQVYPGNTGDPATMPDQVEKLREDFGLSRAVFVGDRGMLTNARIECLREHPGLGWISALRSGEIRKLVESGDIQLTLFDEYDLAEIASPEYPGERLVACFNPPLAEERRRTRDELLAVTEKDLRRIAAEAARRTRKPMPDEEIAAKVGKVIGRYRMAKHFHWSVSRGRLRWERKEDSIEREKQLDGFYVIRTSESRERLSPENVVRHYKALAQVERAFRTLKGVELRVRPIFHRTEDHVRAHVFLCMLAYYVEWHMRRALAPLLFDDEELPEIRPRRHPVAPAQASPSAKRKKATHLTPDGLPVQSLQTLLAALATRCRNTCRTKTGKNSYTFDRLTEPTQLQARAFELLAACTQ
jgi:transposase